MTPAQAFITELQLGHVFSPPSHFVPHSETTSIHHLARCCSWSSTLLERLVQLCNPVLSFDQRVLGISTRIQLFRCCLLRELQTLEHLRCWLCIHGNQLWKHRRNCSATMTHTYAVLRSKQTAERNHHVCADVLKVCYMQHRCYKQRGCSSGFEIVPSVVNVFVCRACGLQDYHITQHVFSHVL